MDSGWARSHSTIQRGSFIPTGIFFNSGGDDLRPDPCLAPPELFGTVDFPVVAQKQIV